jgi:Rps23 Pro-64 3,4-dihydroxylase Tpa1-like proline 4-hydroxylase
MQVYDNALQPEDHIKILNMCKNSQYRYGEFDDVGLPPTGLVCELGIDDNPLFKKLDNLIPQFRNKIYRFYINCFSPSEMAYFHIDAPRGTTIIYYPHDFYDENEGGETQLLGPEDLIYGIKPRPNRLLIFNSNIRHRATPFRTKHRFTVVIKIRE